MKDIAVFKAFVDVVRTVDTSDDIDRIRKSVLNLHTLLVRKGYDENVTWEDALRNAL